MKNPNPEYTELFLEKTRFLLKDYRKRVRLTQKELAECLEVNETTFNKLENGKDNMYLWTFAFLLDKYGISLNTFANDLTSIMSFSTYCNEQHITKMFENCVNGVTPPKSTSAPRPKKVRPPKPDLIFNEITNKWEILDIPEKIIPCEPESIPVEEKYDLEKCKTDFTIYLQSDDGADKLATLIQIDELYRSAYVKKKALTNDKKSFIKASLKYITSHPDSYKKEQFRAYYKFIQEHSTGVWKS